MASFALSPGTVLGEDYRIVRPLSEGGMGAVYVAEQLSTGRQRALKAMKPGLITDARSRERFIEEARVASKIGSAHVVEVIAAGVDVTTGVPWLAMELLEGEDLEGRVARGGPLPLDEIVTLFTQLAHALGRAHQKGIIHRDLKPENLFLADSNQVGAAPLLKVLDFGIAAFVGADKTAATSTSAIGSPLWIAPEQTRTGAKLRPSTDVWAMGLIAFYLCTGKSYWPAANAEPFNLHALLGEILAHPLLSASARAAELGVSVPAGFDGWFARCVVRDLDPRFENADVAAAALAELGGGASGLALSPTLSAAGGDPPSHDAMKEPSTGPYGGQGHPPGHAAPASATPWGQPSPSAGHGPSSVPAWQRSGPAGARPAGAFSTTPRQSGSRGPLLVAVGGVVAFLFFGGMILAGAGIFAVSDEDTLAGPLAQCESAIEREDFDAAVAAGRRAVEATPGSPEAHDCSFRAGWGQSQQATYRQGVAQLNAGDAEQAVATFGTLDEASPFRDRPEVQQAAEAYASARLQAARDAVAASPREARQHADFVLTLDGATAEQRAEASALREAMAPSPAAFGSAPSGMAPSAPPVAPAPADDAEVRACILRGDNACVIRLLEGRASSERELSRLVEAYRARGQRAQAAGHMRTYVERYPSAPRANVYRQILSRR